MTDLSLIIIAFVVLLISTYAAYQYSVHETEGKVELKQLFALKMDLSCFLVIGAAFVISVYIFARGFLQGDDTYMRALMNAEIFIWLAMLGYIDFKEKIIPNVMIVCGLLFWGIVVLIDIVVSGTPWSSIAVFSLTGGLVCGGVLFIIAIIVKSALGMGDVKLFTVLGLFYGIMDTYSILLFTIVLMAIISIVLLIAKKVTMKTAVPMAPFVAAGFFLSILAGM